MEVVHTVAATAGETEVSIDTFSPTAILSKATRIWQLLVFLTKPLSLVDPYDTFVTQY